MNNSPDGDFAGQRIVRVSVHVANYSNPISSTPKLSELNKQKLDIYSVQNNTIRCWRTCDQISEITCFSWRLLTSTTDFSPQTSEPGTNFVAEHHTTVFLAESCSNLDCRFSLRNSIPFNRAKMPVPVSAPGGHGSHGPSVFDKSRFSLQQNP